MLFSSWKRLSGFRILQLNRSFAWPTCLIDSDEQSVSLDAVFVSFREFLKSGNTWRITQLWDSWRWKLNSCPFHCHSRNSEEEVIDYLRSENQIALFGDHMKSRRGKSKARRLITKIMTGFCYSIIFDSHTVLSNRGCQIDVTLAMNESFVTGKSVFLLVLDEINCYCRVSFILQATTRVNNWLVRCFISLLIHVREVKDAQSNIIGERGREISLTVSSMIGHTRPIVCLLPLFSLRLCAIVDWLVDRDNNDVAARMIRERKVRSNDDTRQTNETWNKHLPTNTKIASINKCRRQHTERKLKMSKKKNWCVSVLSLFLTPLLSLSIISLDKLSFSLHVYWWWWWCLIRVKLTFRTRYEKRPIRTQFINQRIGRRFIFNFVFLSAQSIIA